MKILLKDYAEQHNISSSFARRKAMNGRFKTAEKIGCQWFIDEDEEYLDLRRKENKMEK